MRAFVILAAGLAAATPLSAQRKSTAEPAPALDASVWGALKFRYIGPEGNRVSSVAGVIGDPMVYYAGSASGGVFKSSDGGKTWTKMGLDLTGRISRIAIDPRDPEVVLVGALGHAYGPQQERGVYRTTDAGRTWSRTLFVNDSTGVVDLVMNRTNPRIVYAATWQVEI